MRSWTSAQLLLCVVASLACCCDWLHTYGHLSKYGHLSNHTLVLLEQMGGPMTEQKSPVSFPYAMYRNLRRTKVESRLVFVRDSLDLIGQLYGHGNMSAVTWNTDKMELFLINIDRQRYEVNNCVAAGRRADKRLRRYYKKLSRETLHKMGYRRESWELLRRETKKHLELLYHLLAVVKK